MSAPAGPPTDTSVCVRHPDRPTGLRCTRCDRPACPACLREASVGMQCVDCVSAGASTVRRGRPLRSGPVVVPALIAANVLVFVLTVIDAGSVANNASGVVFAEGALVPSLVAADWWRPITSGFLHIGLIHLAFNMLALWFVGRDIEIVLGRLRFSVLYGVSLLGGSAGVMLFGGADQAVAGASGAIFGLLGALVVLLRRIGQPATSVLVIIGLNVVLSVTLPGISLLGHLGGLVTGVVVAAALAHGQGAWRSVGAGAGRSGPAAGLVAVGAVVVVLVAVIVVRALVLA